MPTREPLDDWTDELDDRYLLCRDIGHTWRPFRAQIADSAYWRVMRCGRCKTEREQTLSMSGEILAGHYNYPEGYLTPAGTGRLYGHHRAHLRLESVLRLIGKDDGQ